jgi:uncharacterized membrane-anchored protein YhcB (DUF1043 family)
MVGQSWQVGLMVLVLGLTIGVIIIVRGHRKK